ncbi:hypothetical protein GCM10023187_12930 [Nibrella viscosa]|uniref:Two component regulator propeller n=1 Tax=Nibrella viscosa TaxID=1084524 RepID=A0ABP8K4C8_9BACT
MREKGCLPHFCLLLVISGRILCAQPDSLQFQYHAVNPERPLRVIFGLYQDQEGFMWIGSYQGLARYDGTTFTLYKNKTDALDSGLTISSGRIFSFEEDQKGHLWFPTNGSGLHQLHKRTGEINVYPVDSGRSRDWNYATSIFKDQQGRFWLNCTPGLACFDPVTQRYVLYTSPKGQLIDFMQKISPHQLWGINSEGLWRFDLKTHRLVWLPLVSASGKKLSANSVHIDAQGTAWIGTLSDGLFRADTSGNSRTATPYNPMGLVSNPMERNSVYEADGYLWLATKRGLQRINPRTHQVITFRSNLAMPTSLITNDILTVYKDRMENLWVGTIVGINRTSLLPASFERHQITPAPYPFYRQENVILSILEDHTGTIWVVNQVNGLFRLNPKTHRLTQVVIDPKVDMARLAGRNWSLCEDRQGQLWVGVGPNLYRLNRTTGQFSRFFCDFFIQRICLDKNGKFWLAGYEGTISPSTGLPAPKPRLAYFNPATGAITHYRMDAKDPSRSVPGDIRNLLISETGHLWLTTSGGLSRFNPQTGRFTHVQPQYRRAEYNHDLTCLYEDHQGLLWIGSRSGGLNRFDPRTGLFTQYTTRHGLLGNRVNGILGDQWGNLWLGTDYGLSRFTPATGTFRSINDNDGLPTVRFFMENSAYNHQGKLLFGTRSGFFSFYPDSLKEPAPVELPVHITGYAVREQSRPLPEGPIELNYDENFLSFEFVAVNFDAPARNRYAYRLVGLEPDWVYSGSRRQVNYTDLAPGQYEFRVQATRDDKTWHPAAASIILIIHPPWWRTWWFVSLMIATVLSLGYHAFRYRVEQIRREEQQKAAFSKKLSEMEMQALRAQMNPHFIFNSLNSINTFILKNEPESASEYLAKFSRLIRLILHNSNSTVVTLDNELEALRLYLDMESLRFRNKFTYRITIGPEVEPDIVEIPPLLIQPYVENAIWHGIMHKEEPGHIRISLDMAGDMLVCNIEDDGIGRRRAAELKSKSATKRKSLGMQITAHRIKLINELHGKETTMQVVDLVDALGEPCGTRVVLHIAV